MTILQYNLQDLFQKQFKYRPADYNITDPDGSKNYKSFSNNGDLKIENIISKKSQQGNYGSYYASDALGRTIFMPITIGGLFLPYSWLSITGAKRIVETSMTERRGTVKEHISMEDYNINVKGFIIGHDGTFPEKDAEALKTLYERNEALEINSILTDIFLLTGENGGQDKVVISDFSFNENPGVEHIRAYEFNLVTDQEFELEIL
ncbi:MAG: DUF6046 domain-containing protein [Chitinophagales bacterium]|nr:DUF6046 domain-containing protein [Chitinophagales bacterium]